MAKIQNRDRHTLGDALVVLNPLAICLRYWGHLEARSQKNVVILGCYVHNKVVAPIGALLMSVAPEQAFPVNW